MEHPDLESLELDLLLEAIVRRYGYDFRDYARASMERRTAQFVSTTGLANISSLTAAILHDEALFSRLVQYYSVGVTELFRDPQVYKTIRTQVIPLLRTWPHIKVWCAGCATGEEVYTIAILLKEEGLYDKSTLYATDFNDASLDVAKSGVYSIEKIQAATRNYQLSGGTHSFSDYYHAKYDSVVMDSSLKARITFANHNLVVDQVFGEMHLVLCRNVMIYFNRTLQERTLDLFVASLVHRGFLCLGTMEDIQFTAAAVNFEALDARSRIYRKTLTQQHNLIGGDP